MVPGRAGCARGRRGSPSPATRSAIRPATRSRWTLTRAGCLALTQPWLPPGQGGAAAPFGYDDSDIDWGGIDTGLTPSLPPDTGSAALSYAPEPPLPRPGVPGTGWARPTADDDWSARLGGPRER